MSRHGSRRLAGAAILVIALSAQAVLAEEINLYSSRHYDTDVALYQGFTAETGIDVNLIEGSEDELIERIKAEGAEQPGRRADHGRRRPAVARRRGGRPAARILGGPGGARSGQPAPS